MKFRFSLLAIPLLLFAKSPVLLSLEKASQKGAVTPPPQESPLIFTQEEARGDFRTEFTFLYWQGSEDGLEFAAKNQPRFPSSTTLSTNLSASLISPEFSWEPGFKFLFGYHFADSSWDLDGRWTWIFFKSSGSASNPISSDGKGLFPIWIAQQAAIASTPVYANSSATHFLHFNTFDIDLSCSGGLSKALFFKVLGGLKGIAIDQKYNVSYSNGFSDGTNEMLSSTAHLKNKCNGLGPRFGLGTRWGFPGEISLIGEFAVSSALSQMKTKREDVSLGLTSGTLQTVNIHSNESFWVWRPLIEAKAAVNWNYLWGKRGLLALEVAYEMQQFWEQNMMIRYADSAIFFAAFNSRGNLFVQGLSLSATVGY